mgnify:FL=1
MAARKPSLATNSRLPDQHEAKACSNEDCSSFKHKDDELLLCVLDLPGQDNDANAMLCTKRFCIACFCKSTQYDEWMGN